MGGPTGMVSTALEIHAGGALGGGLIKGAGYLYRLRRANKAARSGIALSRKLGKAGEKAVGDIGKKKRIESLTGTAKFRVPDGMTTTTLSEVKNVAKLSYTRQLKDFNLFAQKNKLKFDLYMRSNTQITKNLEYQIKLGNINPKIIKGH